MIPSPFGWSIDNLAHGIALTHPRGASVGSIVYRDRARPLRRVGALVRELLATLPHFKPEAIGQPERLVTLEGEHAALVTITGTEAGKPAQRDLGYVLADDFYAAVSGLCFDVELRASFTELVRTLTQQDTQALGLRRRRFDYKPPPSWQPLPRSLATEWIAPGYPRDTTWLVVYAANPRTLVTTTVETSIAYLKHLGYHVEEQAAASEVTFETMSGSSHVVMATAAGKPALLREIVVLQDPRFTYTLELSSHTPATWVEARNTLKALLQTVRPVPPPNLFMAAPKVLVHWAE